MSSVLSESTRGALSAFVTARIGLRFPPDRWDELERGVVAACRELGVSDVEAWANGLLVGVPTFAQLQTLANQLTVGETYFYRHGEVFRVLANLLPRLAARHEPHGELRLWSAACSTGEEAYSLAMLVQETLPDAASRPWKVLGTDVNSRSLTRATRGVYSNWSFRDAPAWLKTRYFRAGPRNTFEILPGLRDRVRFSLLNLVEDPYPLRPGGYDVIFCRNVLMYFSTEWQEVILHRLWHALAEGGVLAVSPCDTSPTLTERFQPLAEAPSVYVRRTTPTVTVAVPEFSPAFAPVATGVIQPFPEPAPAPSPVLEPVVPTPVATENPIRTTIEQAREQADSGDLEQALALCDRALTEDKLNVGAHFLRGCILQELQQPIDAGAAFRRVLFLEPNHLLAHFSLGTLARHDGDEVRAHRHFQEAMRLLQVFQRGEVVPGTDGLTAGRLLSVLEVQPNLAEPPVPPRP